MDLAGGIACTPDHHRAAALVLGGLALIATPTSAQQSYGAVERRSVGGVRHMPHRCPCRPYWLVAAVGDPSARRGVLPWALADYVAVHHGRPTWVVAHGLGGSYSPRDSSTGGERAGHLDDRRTHRLRPLAAVGVLLIVRATPATARARNEVVNPDAGIEADAGRRYLSYGRRKPMPCSMWRRTRAAATMSTDLPGTGLSGAGP
jgi:hypothetical protein